MAHAEITAKYLVRYKNSTRYDLDTRFVDSAGTWTNSLEVGESRYDALKIGDTIPIYYLPENHYEISTAPVTRSEVAAGLDSVVNTAIFWIIVSPLALLVCEGILRAEYNLVRNGLVATAIVESVTLSASQHTVTRIIKYGFDLDGRRVSGTADGSSQLIAVKEGDAIDVFYDPTAPSVNKPVAAIKYVDVVD